ncbi:hypothetical protein GGH94_002732 [Coemansia aciculifera]|uniref:Uncharacterized protein n=1 Tax=Coemansia aciculifera TaxID=417176 RepID=A0A9W8III7_9FUNG|nr:hypothetical protein GGH94_002732 [Coemansia aciculifera]
MSRMLWLTATRRHALQYSFLRARFSTRDAPASSQHTRQPSRLRDTDSLTAQINELDKQSAALPEPQSPAANEQRTLELMSTCHQLLLNHITTISATDTLRLCQVADRLSQQTMLQQRDAVSLSSDLFTSYLQFYAHLGRPDITQQAFNRVKRQWRQPSAAVYGAQQLALLRFSADQATGNHLLSKTTVPGESANDLASKVSHRLTAQSVSLVIRDIMRHERRTRRLVKVLEYGSYAALATLIAKWMWIGNSVLMAGMGTVPKALASSAALIVAGTCVRWALRRSVMGTLTAPALLPRTARQSAAEIDLPKDSDNEARRILRRAFPASPSDDAMLDINEILYSGALRQPRLSWKLKLALAWSRLARRFAIVEPMLTSTHDMHQRLAAMWLRNLVQMFPPHANDSASGRQRAASDALEEFVAFAYANFQTIPLALSRSEISALSGFAAHEASTEAFTSYLRLVTAGSLGLIRSTEGKKEGHSVHPAEDSPTAFKPDDFFKHRAGAIVLTYIACIQRLSRSATHREKLSTLLTALQTNLEMPVSASLYRAAFAASADQTLGDTAHRLASSLESRFQAQDPFALHIVRNPPDPQKSLGWKLRTTTPAKPMPVVYCLAPYLAMLARESATHRNSLAEAIDRWTHLGMLSPVAAIQCLDVAVHALPTSALLAESWAILGCTYASDPHTEDLTPIAQSLDSLLLTSLKICDTSETVHLHATRILEAWRIATDRQPKLKSLSSADLNSQVATTLATLSLSATAEAAKEYAQMARDTLDLMHYLGQTPAPSAIDRLRQAAAHSGVDVAKVLRHWTTHHTKKHPENKDISAFAKSLF